jgi:MtN3 and saliva related transmembrane protein
MYLLFTFGVFMWLIYWIQINSLPVILANSITLILAWIILIYKIKYK